MLKSTFLFLFVFRHGFFMGLEFFSSRNKVLSLFERIPKEHSLNALEKAFDKAIENNISGSRKAAVLFSGGIDSSLVAFALSGKLQIMLYCAGVKGSAVFKRAKKSSKLIGLPLKRIVIEKKRFPVIVERVAEAIASRDLLQVQIALPEFEAMNAIMHDGYSDFFSGQGADELFCGYAEFLSVLSSSGYKAVEEKRREKLLNFFERNAKREIALAEFFGLNARIPFLEEGFMREALAFPVEEMVLSEKDSQRKHPLRALACKKGLPEEICSMPKKAMQFDAGIAKEVKAILSVD